MYLLDKNKYFSALLMFGISYMQHNNMGSNNLEKSALLLTAKSLPSHKSIIPDFF